MAYILPDTTLLTIKAVAESENEGTFIIEPLSPGYGVTVGNSLRRILLNSLEGAAVSSVRIDGAPHEFTTLPGVREDIVALVLNLKQLRMRLHGDEAANLVLQKKGPGVVTAADFKSNSAVEFMNPDHVIAHLDKNGKLNMEIEVINGRGYSSVETRKETKMPLGTIALDCAFSPVTRVNYDIENTRVGNLTNYDKLNITIKTDGSITPRDALQTASRIAVEHFAIIGGVDTQAPTDSEMTAVAVETAEDVAEDAPKKRRTRKTKDEVSE